MQSDKIAAAPAAEPAQKDLLQLADDGLHDLHAQLDADDFYDERTAIETARHFIALAMKAAAPAAEQQSEQISVDALAAALGWPEGVSSPMLDGKTLLQEIAKLRVAKQQGEPSDLRHEITALHATEMNLRAELERAQAILSLSEVGPDSIPTAVMRERAERAERESVALRAELAEARKDAARYRYLRDRVPSEVLGQVKSVAGCWIDSEDEEGNLVLLTGSDADTTIDAALAKGKA